MLSVWLDSDSPSIQGFSQVSPDNNQSGFFIGDSMSGYSVYFVHAGEKDFSPVKIGVTSNIDRRLAKMQTGNPYRLICKALIPCESKEQAYALESFIHSKIYRHRMIGEWFRSEYFKLPEILAEFNSINDFSVSNKKVRITVDNAKVIHKLKLENESLRLKIIYLEQCIDELLDAKQLKEIGQ